jgi:chromosomal replication initiator protein
MESITELSNIWSRVLTKLKDEINNNHIFDVFFKDSYIYTINQGKMYIVVTSGLAVNLIETKYHDMLDSIVKDVTQTDYKLVITKQEDLDNNKLPSAKEETVFFKDSKINPRYTFDNFVVGLSNREANQASLIVASNMGNMYNPLFIYSDSGLGKTHLLHAIGNYIKQNSPRTNVLVISTDQFVEEYIRSAKGEEDINELKNYLKKVDVLLIDDIQFLANKTKTEEFFFPIFNYFVSNNKQIVLTCDRRPIDLEGLEQRLVTRFSQGLLTSISKPEKSVCVEILKKKIVQNGLDINNFDEDALEFLADKFSSSVRDLEGALLKLLNYTINFKPTSHIDLNTAIEAVSGLLNGVDAESEVSEKKIINIVAEYYNLTQNQILGNSHIKQITLARHISMYLIRSELDVSFTKIGQLFGNKDHSTVMSGVNKVENLLKTDEQMRKVITELKAKINKK